MRTNRQVAALIASAFLATSAQAQISRDDTSGQVPGDIDPIGNVYTIDGQDGIRAGTNNEIVVHSMTEFNLAADETAVYTDAAPFLDNVTNVLTRVTGGNASTLNGRIESLYPNADLFFVNPNGVFFGAGFTIDIPGSFHASTADSLEWEQGISIDMGLATDIPVLTAAVPLAWGFLGAGPEKLITVEGFTIDDQAQIDQGETIAFIGGDVALNMNTALQTKGRDFLAVAVGTAGGVDVDPVATRAALGPNTPNGTLTLDLLADGVVNSTGTDNGPFGGDFTLIGGDIDVTVGSTAPGNLGTGFGTTLGPSRVDDSGDFTFIGDDILIQGAGGRASLQTESDITQGSFVVDASDSITFVDDVRFFGRALRSDQDASDMTVTAGGTVSGQVWMFAGNQSSGGTGGTVQIDADVIDLQGLRIHSSAETGGVPGDVSINARQITIDGGAGTNSIFAATIDNSTASANVLIEATESLEFTNFGINASNTGVFAGFGGDVVINSPVATADASFAVDVSSALGTDGTFTGTAFPQIPDRIFRDATAGQTEGLIAPVGDIYEIHGNDGIRRDSDSIVIHSFDRFALEDFETARYTDDAGFIDSVDHVFTRVTGNASSQIDGTIESLYTNADLIFVNPNGMIFGDGFTLDTTASFHASTADALVFDSGLTLDLTSTSDIPSLDGLEPASWSFINGGAAGDIQADDFNVVDNGALPAGSTLNFVGANVDIFASGGLISQGRSVVVVAAGGPGNVDFNPDPDAPGPGVAPTGDVDITGLIMSTNDDGSSGDITLWGGDVSVSGTLGTGSLPTVGGSAPNAGDVRIVANELNHTGAISTGGELEGGNILIEVAGNASFGAPALSSLGTGATSTGGTSGDITIQVGGELTARDFFVTSSTPSGESDAGDINFSADTIDLQNFFLTADGGDGQAGSINFDARTISLVGPNGADGINVASDGTSDAGTVDIIATESIDLVGLTIDASNTGTGDGGVVTIEAPAVTADGDFAVNVSAIPPAQDGSFISAILNPVDPPIDPPTDPPADPGLPPLSETAPPIDSIDYLISFDPEDLPPPAADDATAGGGIDVASNSDPNAPSEGGDLASVSAPGGTESDDEEDESSSGAPDGTTSDEQVASLRAPGETDPASEEDEPAFDVDEYLEDEPEAAVASAESEAVEKSLRVPGIDLFTRAEQRAPMLPRTCDVIARTGGESKLLARNPRRRPISSEDWLIALDRSGDQLLADLSSDLPAVGSAGPIGSREADAPAHLAAVQRALTAAAVAIRSERYDEAKERFEAAVDKLEGAGDETGASRALFAFSQLQLEDSRFESAQKNLQRALRLAEKNDDSVLIAKVRGSLGNVLIGMGDLNGAESEFNRGIGIALKSKNKTPAPAMLNDLGNRHSAKRDYKSAMWAYQEAATLALTLGRVEDEARARAGAARVAIDVSRLDDAWRLIKRADKLRPTVPNQHARTRLAIHIGHTLATLASVTSDRRDDALRMAGAALDDAVIDAKAIGDEYSLALAYLNLGSLYRDEQHRSEALYLARLARQHAEKIEALDLTYRAHWLEGQILWSAHRIRDSLASHRRAIEILEETKPVVSRGYGATESNFQRRVGGVYRDHVDVLLRASDLANRKTLSQQLINEARATVEKLKGAELRDYFEDECIASVREGGRDVDPGVAVVHTIALPNRLEMLVTLPSGIERYSTKISAAELNGLIDAFRRDVQNPLSNNYMPLSRRLYEVVVAPYAARLRNHGVETLVFVPDGRLRTLPFVALHDGTAFLGDRYSTATTLSLNLLSSPKLAAQAGPALLAGVSESVQGFSPLNAVEQELAEIQGLGGGELLLNKEFTLERVEAAVADDIPGVLHLATHAVFSGNPETSFLLTYDGKVGFGDLSDVVGMTKVEGAPLELLVLSACETAVGNERAGLGFTGSAIRAGARSAVGSLWPIADEAAREFMVEFYAGLNNSELSKAEALKSAQARLRESGRFAHPAYWAPYTLVNDWL